MSAERLNNLLILHIHKDFTDRLNMQEVANEFVNKNERHFHVSGSFA